MRLTTSDICIDEHADPVAAVRATRTASVRLAHRAVRDGHASAAVTASPLAVAVAAAGFTLQSAPGVTQPAFATFVGPAKRRAVLLDAGASKAAGADALVQLALCGAALARTVGQVPVPRIGLLDGDADFRSGRGRPVHRAGALGASLARAGFATQIPGEFVGAVPAEAIAIGGLADVLVVDGATARLLLGAARGAAIAASSVIMEADQPVDGKGGFVLGVNGVSVVARAATPDAVAQALGWAVQAVESELLDEVSASMTGLIANRRTDAGLGTSR